MIDLPAFVRIPPSVLWSSVGGDVVIMDINLGEYFKLANASACIWEAFSKDGSVERAVEATLESFDVDRQTLMTDVGELIAELSRKGLLEIEAESASIAPATRR